HYESVIIQHVDTACFQNVSTHSDEYTKHLIVFGQTLYRQTLISVCLRTHKFISSVCNRKHI
ncbi:MAG: hypothetical protein LBG80_01765, partial [Bacteroidales bacterium]|nr:hypothetical protein [Bacteroidales bacterium]